MSSVPGGLQIRVRKGGTVFHVYGGPNAGHEGVWLAEGGVDGLYDSPVKTTWKTGAFQDGSRQRARKWLHRDLELGFHVIETIATTWQFNDSEFRRVFDYQLDPWETTEVPTVLEVETEQSGVRKLDVLMYDAPEFAPKIDPHKNQHGFVVFKLRAGQPFWYEDAPPSPFSDTTTSGGGTVTVTNPTDRIMHQKWVLTPATWELPDVSWEGSPGLRAPGGIHEDRTIENIEVTEANVGAVVDLDRQELMFRDAADTNLLAQLPGKIFAYPIPPYTPETDLPVVYSAAPTGGAMVQLVQPRRWTRPWGMELDTAGVAGLRPPSTIRFNSPGSYSYTIPEWCGSIDVVLVGGGGGGEGGNLATTGAGGHASDWVTATLVRGDDIPYSTTKITGVIAAGGEGGQGYQFAGPGGVDGGDGGTTTATATGMTSLGSVGGEGGGTGFIIGEGLDDLVFNDVTYHGCGPELVAGHPGNTPGGGGAGGWPLLGAGGDGGRGQIWFRAYGEAGS